MTVWYAKEIGYNTPGSNRESEENLCGLKDYIEVVIRLDCVNHDQE